MREPRRGGGGHLHHGPPARCQDGYHGDGGKDPGHPAVFLSPTALIRVIVRRHRLILLLGVLLLAILLLTVLLLAILPAGLLIVLLVILLVVGSCIELPRLILRLLRAREMPAIKAFLGL